MVIDPPPPEDVFKEKYFEVIAKLVSFGEKRHDIVEEALELLVFTSINLDKMKPALSSSE